MSEHTNGGPQPPPPPNKPRLKINVSRSNSIIADVAAPPASASAAAAPIASTPGAEGPRKVKLKINASTPATPAGENPPKVNSSISAASASTLNSIIASSALPPPTAAPSAAVSGQADEKPVKTKAGRQSKPTQKLVESKKRPNDDDDDEAPLATSRRISLSAHGPTRIKIRQTPKSAPTQLVVKPRGRPPHHPPGDGYDSEASDREIDPAIEEQFILRMLPGEHCDYIRWCMENGKMGIPKSQGGADVQLKFLEEETRRVMVTVKGQSYAAIMVDLPTITETMKTWDRKQFMKSADICQMLLVFQPVKDEAEARKAPLPKAIRPNFKWPHGLTPPMHDCVNRRFAKTISRKEIEDKEAEVERLLMEDAKAATTRWEWIDDRQQDNYGDAGEDEDAEGEVDESVGYFNQGQYEDESMVDNVDLEADLEAAFADTPATAMEMTTPMAGGAVDLSSATVTVAPDGSLQPSIEMDEEDTFLATGGQVAADEEEDEDDDDDDDDEDDEDLDEDQRAEKDEHQAVMDMIRSLEKQMASKQAELSKLQNRILQNRMETQIKQLKSEIDLKKGSIGMETDD